MVSDAESLEDTAVVEMSALDVVVEMSALVVVVANVVLVSCDKLDVNKNVVMPKK